MATEPPRNVWFDVSQLLDLHLTRSIEKFKEPKGTQMALSKFQELAKTVRDTRKNFDEQADELLAEHDDLRREGEMEFARYRDHHKQVRTDIQAMRDMLSDMQGGNNPPPEKPLAPKEEGSGNSSENFQSKPDGEH
jgi:hypothetical protein